MLKQGTQYKKPKTKNQKPKTNFPSKIHKIPEKRIKKLIEN